MVVVIRAVAEVVVPNPPRKPVHLANLWKPVSQVVKIPGANFRLDGGTMSEIDKNANDLDVQPTMSLEAVLMIFLASIVGAFAAAVVLPTWLPGLSQSLLGAEPKAYWYLSRTSGIVAYMLLWISTALGIMVTNKMARAWPGGPTAVDIHQYASLLALAIAIFHALILFGDRYMNFSLAQLAIPFATGGRQQTWIGMGQLGFYVMIPVAFSFYARRFMGYRMWRIVHYASFIVYILVTAHGLWSGSDTSTPALMALYSASVLATYFLTMYRIFVSIRQPHRQVG